MSSLSSRQLRLIDLLLEQQQDVTVAYIADMLGISARTVHRELNSIEQYLTTFGIELQKKSGSGIRLAGDDKQLAALQGQLHNKLPADMDAAERKISVLCILLQQLEPIKLYSLAHELHVTMPTVSYDLDDLESIISLHQLQLVRRRGYGVELTGHELDKRKLIATLVTSYLDDSQLISYVHAAEATQPIANHLLSMVGRQTFQIIEQIVWSMQERLDRPLKETTYTRLLLHMSIAVTRFMSGHPLPAQQKQLQSELTDELAQQLVQRLDVQLPPAEKLYLEQLLRQAFEQDQELNLYAEQPYINEVVTKLSHYVEQHMQEPVTQDASLNEGLVRHMLPALQRIQEGLAIRNPMLSQIKKDYAQLYSIIATHIQQLMPHIQLPEEEIGYITMHYGAAIERLKQLPGQLKAIIVCTSGIGSSKLLASRLAKEFPQIEQIGHYSWYEAARLPRSYYDFIISTVNLPLEPNQYIRLSPLITSEEIAKLKQYMQSYALARQAPLARNMPPQQAAQAQHWFQELQLISRAALQIMEPFDRYIVESSDPSRTIHELLPELLLRLKEQTAIQNVDAVVQQLLLREKQGSIVLPDTAIAFIHARHEAVAKPIVALFRLSRKISLRSDEDTQVQHILLMLAPKRLDKYSLEILSELSAMLLLPELIQLLQHAEAAQIKSFISNQLEQHFKHKLNWRD